MDAEQQPRREEAPASAPATPSATPQPAAGTTHALPDDALIILPLRNMVLFPGMVAPVHAADQRTIAAAQEAVRAGRQVGTLLQREPSPEGPPASRFHQIGTVASILRYVTAQDNEHYLVCQGHERFRIVEFLDAFPFDAARVERLPQPAENTAEIQALFLQLKERSREILELVPQVPRELVNASQDITSASQYADFVAGLMDLSPQEKQGILETLDLTKRLEQVLDFLVHRIEVLRLSQKITRETQGRMDARQREYMLREQMKTIQAELGESDKANPETADLAEAIEKAQLPPDVLEHARKELKRLEKMPEAAAEYSMLRTYLEWLSELPWSTRPAEEIYLPQAGRVLDEDHFDLEKIKRRILEYLAVRKLNPHGKSPILCFVGPPGVGKTSLGQSIARATGREFVRVSLGGVHDEAEIRGHRRTYIGALPGNIIQSIRKAGTRNCVMMLDEIDKLGAGVHGDPAAALLEVLDPEQNATFRDNYLGVPFDLSGVLFICTANVLDAIPGPLRDRMEIISLSGYTEAEKAEIARRYLLERQRKENGLQPGQCIISDDVVRSIIHEYTREAGVRNLEREIGSVFRYAALRIAEGTMQQVRVDVDDLPAILGPKKFESEVAMRTSLPGVATGLAWTPVGGDILFIEASRTPGGGRLILTGQLGDVMKESAQAALTLVKARSADLGLGQEAFEKSDIHVHVPAGAVPKDGPSAGVAMFIALASLLIDRPVRSDCAMTGEISLRGLVLPVGGIKEKVLAALQAGISTVLLPARNRKELDDIPEDARKRLQFVWLTTVDDAMEAAIGASGKEADQERAAG
jgi:ATP-dependent Lon protease